MPPAIKTWSTPVREETREAVPCILCGGGRFAPSLQCEDFSFVRCVRCGLIQQNPRPAPQEIAARYSERSGDAYLAYEIANEDAFLRLQLLALNDARFSVPAGKRAEECRVLDVGCATGTLLSHLKREGWQTVGVELSPQEAAYARETRGLDVRSLALEDAGFEDGFFDAVVASHLIEHLVDPARFVDEVARIIKTGGGCYITTPNSAGLQARLFGGHWRSAIFDHLYLFSIKTLKRLLETHGFQVERIVTWGGLAAGIGPLWLKHRMDKAAKALGAGDVMLLRARRC